MSEAPRTQAERVIARFGGVPRLAAALRAAGYDRPSKVQMYRWSYTKERGGTGGAIPHWMLEPIKAAAVAFELELTEADLAPGVR